MIRRLPHDSLVTDERPASRREPVERFRVASAPMLEELEAEGIDTADFGIFTSLRPVTFDFAAAAPTLIAWLPRVDDPDVVETIARSLTGQPRARGAGAQALLAAYRRLPTSESSTRWAIANALSTLAGPDDADGVIALLEDREGGYPRQMLCDALVRTKDVRTAETLIDLIDDDTVSGHAILALRRLGRWKSVADPHRTRPRLEAVLARTDASDFAKKQALKALATLGRAAAEESGSAGPRPA